MLLKNITVGSSLSSILYAYLNDNYFIPTLKFGPLFYKTISPKILASEHQDFTWSRLQTIMSLTGKLLNYEGLRNIRIRKNKIKISSQEGLFEYQFGLCNIFDPTNVELENNILQKVPHLFHVFDDFELSSLGAKHRFLEPKVSNEKFAKEIHYYTSSRVDGANYVTDCVVESLLDEQQIKNIDYSDSMSRFAVIRHLTSIGVHGSFMNFYKNGTPKYRKPKVKHKKRIVVPKEMNKYQDSELVKFLDLSVKEVIDGRCP